MVLQFSVFRLRAGLSLSCSAAHPLWRCLCRGSIEDRETGFAYPILLGSLLWLERKFRFPHIFRHLGDLAVAIGAFASTTAVGWPRDWGGRDQREIGRSTFPPPHSQFVRQLWDFFPILRDRTWRFLELSLLLPMYLHFCPGWVIPWDKKRETHHKCGGISNSNHLFPSSCYPLPFRDHAPSPGFIAAFNGRDSVWSMPTPPYPEFKLASWPSYCSSSTPLEGRSPTYPHLR